MPATKKSVLFRVDDEVYAEIQKRAKAFRDTPNLVLRRVLKLGKRKAAAKG